MTEGTSQGLFIVVAIVIFGIFVVLAYILFEDTLSPAMANMFNISLEQATLDIEYGNQFEDGVLVPDKHLQRAIRDTLGLPKDTEITMEHLKSTKLATINANVSSSRTVYADYIYKRGEMDIKSLEGLQHTSNLSRLYLHGNSVENLEPIRGLTNLIALNINMNGTITDLSSVANMKSMNTLYAEGNPYSDISHIKGLTNLLYLNIGKSNVTDASVISNLTNVTRLYINDLSLDNADFLNAFPTLDTLDITNLKGNKAYNIPNGIRKLVEDGNR